MAYVVTKKCIGCKDTACVTVCPCECFHEGPEMLYIDPDICIDCGACAPECPVDAIFHQEDLPDDEQQAIELNKRMASIYPVITEQNSG